MAVDTITSAMSATLSRHALSATLTRLIEERILDEVYAPGEQLNIDALTHECDVGSSPIREALAHLSALVLTATSSYAAAPVPLRKWFEQLRNYRIPSEGWAVASRHAIAHRMPSNEWNRPYSNGAR